MSHDEANGDDATWPQDWGRLLRLARQVAGLSLTELSAITGLSKGYLSKLESGHPSGRNPSRATLAALARALPSFRPLAHTLEPAESTGALALAKSAPALPPLVRDDEGDIVDSPVRLGWRELELLVALLTLSEAALPQPLNAVILSRALRRPMDETVHTLSGLVRMGALERIDSRRPSLPPEYRPSPRFAALTGLQRAGDALVLAASLLAQAPRLRSRDAQRERNEWDA
jgi:transcriptional regulator with XRE-family HTH domain